MLKTNYFVPDAKVPISVVHLFPKIDHELMVLLKTLNPEDWLKPTIAEKWVVRDIAAHLLDGNLRVLSMQRDKYFGVNPPQAASYPELVEWLNQLNADWVQASKRLSPEVLILLHELTGPIVSRYFAELNPMGKAIFPVEWAGRERNINWMHIAREYAEKWLHQQQIREAVRKQGIMSIELFYPVLDTFLRALPRTYEHVDAPNGTSLKISIVGEAGGEWFLIRDQNQWELDKTNPFEPVTNIGIPSDISWKLFSKGITPEEARPHIWIRGDIELGEIILDVVSVMA